MRGKHNADADALSQIPWKNIQVDHMKPLNLKAMLQSKLVTNVNIPEVYPPARSCTETFGCR